MQFPHTPLLVLFDFDGTLSDSISAVRSATNAVLTALGGAETDTTGIIEGMRFETARRLLFHLGFDPHGPWPAAGPDGRALPAHKILVERFYAELMDRLDDVHPNREILDLVETLRGRGAVCGVVSNNRSVLICRVLERWGAAHLFELVLGEDDIDRPKPHPEGILEAMARLGGSPAHTVYVGDGRSDAAAAQAAGVGSVGLSWLHRRYGLEEPDFFPVLAGDAAELGEVLDAWAARSDGTAPSVACVSAAADVPSSQ